MAIQYCHEDTYLEHYFYSLNPSMYYSIAITNVEKAHTDIHPRKKRSPVLKDCLFVNMII